ncbi:hypothetical protein SKAU_G00010540 [Synaphobranchus kaupii]|uniref:Cilia- and flagella-associated protein 251 n=1 Tax=Synaphobranchus kaupii TaxID=118154 RepID=A0A9Q1JB60_SYNKA|nr:hypothetical protein SKAU_G00010540 [Synaphobranchus kaupii]
MSDTDETQSVDSAGEETDVASLMVAPDSPTAGPSEDGEQQEDGEQEGQKEWDSEEQEEDGEEREQREEEEQREADGEEEEQREEDGEQAGQIEEAAEEQEQREEGPEDVGREEEGLAEKQDEPTDSNSAEQPKQSPVSNTTPSSLPPQKRITINSEKYPLNLKWALGMSRTLPVFSLLDEERLEIVYGCANVAVIYDHSSNTQHIFQGHYNPISCLCASEDRRWLVTADIGPESLVLIWETHSGFPVQTLFDCHPEGGVSAMALSQDAKYLVTVGAAEIQRVCIWDWTSEAEGPVCVTELQPEYGCQNHIIFHPYDISQIVSNSESQIVFYTWDKGELDYYTPKLSEKSFNRKVGSLSQSIFSTEGLQAFSGTSLGNAVVWDVLQENSSQIIVQRRALKLIPLQKHGITVLTRTDSFVVTGNAKGHVTFYDEHFKLIKWYDKFDLDSITSISFSKETNCKIGYLDSLLKDAKPSLIRNFVLSTASASVVHVNTKVGELQRLLKEQSVALHAVACHPTLPIVSMGSHCGILRAWDYVSKGPVCSRVFHRERQIQCLAYDPKGFYLAAGFTCGTVYILDAIDLQNKPEEHFRCAHDGITHIAFSRNSHYLATADTGKAVTLYQLCSKDGKLVWDYQWRHRYHYEPIQDLLFGEYPGSTQTMLLTLGMDRRLVEYDLKNSGEEELRIQSSVRVEQSATPTCMAWYPPLTSEQFLLTTATNYKMKLFNSTKMCRKTLLGPTHNAPVQKMVVLPPSLDRDPNAHYLAYIAVNKLGLQTLPVDGNPYKYSALICHPSGISGFACSCDGKYIFTSGGNDCTVCCWEINVNALEAEAALGGQGIVPFYTLLEGGREGQLFKDITDYFYYCQLHLQGIDSMEPRQVSTRIPLTELSVMMRALGFFPSDREIEDMQNEVKYSRFAETGVIVRDIDLEDFIRLYINHRPVVDNSREELQRAFSVLGHLSENGERVITRDEMLHLVQTRGEPMTQEELAECFTILLGVNPEGGVPDQETFNSKDSKGLLERMLPEEISLETFMVDVLGWPMPEAKTPTEPEASYT